MPLTSEELEELKFLDEKENAGRAHLNTASKFSIENIPVLSSDEQEMIELLEKEKLNLERESQKSGFELSPDLSTEDFNTLSRLRQKESLTGLRTALQAMQIPVEETFKARAEKNITETLKPFKTMFKVQTEEAFKGIEHIKSGISGLATSLTKPTLRDVLEEDLKLSVKQMIEGERARVLDFGKLGIGALEYGFSPITALEEGFVGEPVRNLARESGLPDDIAELLGTAATMGTAFLVPVAVTKQIQKSAVRAGEPLKVTEPRFIGRRKTTEKILKEEQTEFEKNVKPELRAQVEGKGKDFGTPVSLGLFEDITNASKLALEGTPEGINESRRIFLKITDKLISGEIDADSIPKVLANNNLSAEEFARLFQFSASFAGKTLNRLSQVAKHLKRSFEGEEEAMRIFDDIAKGIEKTTGDKIINAIRHFEDFRRSILVTQLATALRNAWSQAGRITISAFDESLQGLILGFRSGNMQEEVMSGLNGFMAMFNRLSPSKRAKLLDILDKNSDVVESARLLSQPVHEVIITNKISKILNTLNRAQEHFFRKLAFEAKLRQLLTRNGLNYDTVDPKKIPEDLIAQSVDYALEMTFAATPKAKWARKFIQGWRSVGATTINPFPRFAFGNALPFLVEHSPLGYLRAMSPKALRELASGNPELFARRASRALIGNLMFLSAWQIRQSKYAGEKGYQIVLNPERPEGVDAKILDTRAFAPLSTYLMIAEMFIHPENITPSDIAQMAIGLNRMAGSGLVIADLVRPGMTTEGASKIIKRFLGELIGSFTVPFRQFKDFADAIPPEETVFRDSTRDPILAPYMEKLPIFDSIITERITAPTLKNIPFISQKMEERIIPTRVSKAKQPRINVFGLEIPASVFRQLTGFTIFEKNIIEQELDKINFPRFTIRARTGIPEADNELARIMIPSVFNNIPKLIKTFSYKSLTVSQKRHVMRIVFQQIREEARKQLVIENPFLMNKVRINQRSRDEKLIIQQQLEQTTPEIRNVLESVGVSVK